MAARAVAFRASDNLRDQIAARRIHARRHKDGFGQCPHFGVVRAFLSKLWSWGQILSLFRVKGAPRRPQCQAWYNARFLATNSFSAPR